jgi:hypothetical protein
MIIQNVAETQAGFSRDTKLNEAARRVQILSVFHRVSFQGRNYFFCGEFIYKIQTASRRFSASEHKMNNNAHGSPFSDME